VAVLGAPQLPPGRDVVLVDRGRTFVRELPGPPGAPTVLLLHGWTATADLNWFTAYESLGRHYRVVALDHRGHGRGIDTRNRFRLADCADDAAAVVEHLGLGPVVAVGYSMGGPIAQLLWQRHRSLVSGLVLCATADRFASGTREGRAWLNGVDAMARMARLTPEVLTRTLARRVLSARVVDGPLAGWARSEILRASPRMLIEAGGAIGRYDASSWIGTVDVPTAIVLTEHDNVVPPGRQRRLAASIPGSRVFPVSGDHSVCATDPEAFVPSLVAACRYASSRAAAEATRSP
jgi:pimeloyl-ACP methyl ester carboxylesterase